MKRFINGITNCDTIKIQNHKNKKHNMANTQTMTAEMPMTETPKFLSGAQAIMQCLVENNVKTIFGYPGGQLCLHMMPSTTIKTV